MSPYPQETPAASCAPQDTGTAVLEQLYHMAPLYHRIELLEFNIWKATKLSLL